MRLRQVVLAAADLEATIEQIDHIFGNQVAFRDPGVEFFALRNAVFAIGDTFLEVVSPLGEEAAAERYRRRRGGDCGYMVMVQCDDFQSDRERAEQLGVRIVWSAELGDISGMHLHPRDTGGPLLSLDQPVPADSWRWAGPDWRQLSDRGDAREVLAAHIADPDPAQRAARWGEILGKRAQRGESDWRIDLDQGALLFSESRDDADLGLVQIDLSVADPASALSRARARDCADGDDVVLCRTRFHLVATG